MKRWVHALSGVPWISTTTRVMGEKQIATFERMCERTGRKPFELASDIVLGELWEAGDNPKLRKLAREQRRYRLNAVKEG